VEKGEDKAMRVCWNPNVFLALILLAGCSDAQPTNFVSVPGRNGRGPLALHAGMGSPDGKSDLEKVRSADISVLFVGNSHTMMQDLPNLVCQMMQFRHPEKEVYAHVVGVTFLENAARDPRCGEEIESRPWKYVVLQAQKISMSGRNEYSRQEGIDIAKQAKAHGCTVFFFSEWGRKFVPDEGPRTEKIYQEMAQAAGVKVAPVGRAWGLALAQRPNLPLHAPDGNHQSSFGAFLTACVLAGRLTGESPAQLASFSYPNMDEKDRQLLADAAAKALAEYAADAAKP
jgi:hypothetical protein